MPFVSHAQNLEDVMLWRALGAIGEGFYIDVGANDPDVDSVTKLFYDRGWRGINIEPGDICFKRLEALRPRDVNIRAVASDVEGVVTFFESSATGLSTTERALAEQNAKLGYTSVEVTVDSLTLDGICRQHVAGEVHFLKIDVEGGTPSVLRGLDLSRVRPWVIVVEATVPMQQVDDFADWEPMLTGKDYLFVYADGLNRFYIAAEHPELRAHSRFPPNVFDGFVPAAVEEARRKLAEAEALVCALAERNRALEAEKVELEKALAVAASTESPPVSH